MTFAEKWQRRFEDSLTQVMLSRPTETHCWVISMGRRPYCAKCGDSIDGEILPFGGCPGCDPNPYRQQHGFNDPFNKSATHQVTIDTILDAEWDCLAANNQRRNPIPNLSVAQMTGLQP